MAIVATKTVNSIVFNKKQYDKILRNYVMEKLEQVNVFAENSFNKILAFVNKATVGGGNIYIKDKDIYYNAYIGSVMANIRKNNCGSYVGITSPNLIAVQDVAGFAGELMSWEETARFVKTSGDYRLQYHGKEYDGIIYRIANTGSIMRFDTYNNCTVQPMGSTSGRSGNMHVMWPVHHFHGINCGTLSGAEVLFDLLEYDLTPDNNWFGTEDMRKSFATVKKIFDENKKYLIVKDDATFGIDTKIAAEDVINGVKPPMVNGKLMESIAKRNIPITQAQADEFVQDLLTCDQNRAALDPYDDKMLYDINRGHWDLWDYDENITDDDKACKVNLNEGLIARDPVVDVNTGGIVAIDFGTKSTVVVYKDENNNILPLQVGSGEYVNGVQADNYENPTVMQFIDLQSFIDAYKAREGRPFTSWEDVTVSHTAFSNMSSSNSDNYSSFCDSLKQYCATSGLQIQIKDRKGNVCELPPYLELDSTIHTLDPIEIYAYYLGLYINNMMQEKRIFMEYRMSFPVKYERNVREKMLRSFRKGLMKSLPTALLSNEEAMKSFKVLEYSSEPAAYAITALQQLGFEPEDEDKVYYGVFDFGGGTTDFDYGVYNEETDPKLMRRYSCRLTHFGANGDSTLGGENLLKLLAYEVFKANYDLLLNLKIGKETYGKIPFAMAPDGRPFMGHEALVKNSQEANQNMHNLVEKLRPVWEKPDDDAVKNILEQEQITVTLFNIAGEQIPNAVLSLKDVDLNAIIKARVEKGVENFFIAMRDAYDHAGEDVAPLSTIPEINIFLAGNSSKSAVVHELFNEYIKEENGKARDLLGFGEKQDMPEFKLWMPLGYKKSVESENDAADTSDEETKNTVADTSAGETENTANEEKAEQQIEIAVGRMAPTGKTGVAYGLLDEEIHVVDKVPHESKEVPYQLYIGWSRRKKFKLAISRGADYSKWVNFMDASDDFDIYYTDKPEGAGKNVPIEAVKRHRVTLEKKDPDKFVFIKPVPSRSVSYMVASSEEECLNPPEGADEPRCIELI